MNRIKIIDFLTGKNVWKYYNLYNKTQWYSKEEMQMFQLNKLKLLLHHCNENIPYYQSIIKERKIDIENFTGLDVLQEFPILTKEILQENYKDFMPTNYQDIKGHKISQTGGTTGNILIKRNDSATRSSAWATYKRYEDWMERRKSDSVLILMGGHVKKRSFKQKIIDKGISLLGNSVTVDIYDTSDKTIEHVIHLLKKNKFSQIRSYPQFLFSVAKKLEKLGLSFNIKSISTTAEPIMPEHRALFKKVFNAEAFDQYGCGEIGGVAYECEKHKGLHIAEERVVVELNKSGDLIITDLENFSMPFIRYWNADQAIFSNQKCSCGRQSQIITQIMGRTCDYVVGKNGQFLHWAYFWHLIFDSNISIKRNLKKFQIVQESNENIKVRLVSDQLSEDEMEFIKANIRDRLGRINIHFSFEEDIENTKTGKYRPVINHMLNQ